jgi:hypothetical protein
MIGCSIGEIIGMSVGIGFNFTMTQKIMASIPLAFLTGYALTI